MSRIFLSHSTENKVHAIALGEWLKSEGWGEPFIDSRSIVPGERWESALHQVAFRCDAVLLLLSREWMKSKWCLEEFSLAFKLNKFIIGVLVENISTEELPEEIKIRQLVDLSRGQDHRIISVVLPGSHEKKNAYFSNPDLLLLKKGLIKAGLDPDFFDWPPPNDPLRPPYRGMRSLEAEDAGIFFGREAPLIQLLAKLRDTQRSSRFMVILGASGAGKSSFLRAGILPRLKRDNQHFLLLPIIRPERAVLTGDTGLLQCLKQALEPFKISLKQIRDTLKAGSEAIGLLLAPLVKPTDSSEPLTLVLSIDQGEELFLADGALEAQRFLALLKGLVLAMEGNILTLITIRSDAYEPLQTAMAKEEIEPDLFNLPPMPSGVYEPIITGPVARLAATPQSIHLDPQLTAALLEDMGRGEGKDALPLLAFTLERLYLEYGDSGQMRLEDYREMGGVQGAIDAAVTRVFKALDQDFTVPRDDETRLRLLRRGLIPWLSRMDQESQTSRRRVARMAEIPQDSLALIQLMIEQRLLVTDVDQERKETTIELTHEALLRQWTLLKGWLQEDSTALLHLDGVQRDARDWERHQRDRDWLTHTGGRLEDAENLTKIDDFSSFLTDLDREYLAACRKQEDHRRNQAMIARNHAEDLVRFILFDLRDKLTPLGRLDLLDMASRKALDYYSYFPDMSGLSQEQQHNRKVGLDNLGNVFVAQGNLTEAMKAYREGMEIARQLADQDPENTNWQRNLSVSHEKIGNVLLAQGDQAGALAHFREGMEIRKRLADQDPKNAAWQRDLSVSLNKIGDVLLAQGDQAGALAYYREGMEIMKQLAAQDPKNTEWQRDISVSLNRIGDVLLAQGDQEGALAYFLQNMEIAKRLAAQDPKNAIWQRDLAVSHDRLGLTSMKMGRAEEAIQHFQQEIAIIEAAFEWFPGQKPFRYNLDFPRNHLKELQK